MPINNIGNHDFEQKEPEQWFPDGWGIDRLVVPFQGSAENEEAFTASLTLWDPSDIDANMFLSSWSSDKDRQWPTVELVYIGKKGGDLPPPQSETDNPVQSSNSSRTSTGDILASPATVEYHAQTNQISYISRGGPGTDNAEAPTADIVPIDYTFGDTTFSISGVIETLIAQLFTLKITSTIQSKEIVPGEYWQNVARTTKSLTPFVFDVPSGPLVTLASPGDGYTAGDTLTISSGGESATIVVDSVGSVWGGGTGILDYHVTADSFTVAHNLLPAGGGTGSDAKFNVSIIP